MRRCIERMARWLHRALLGLGFFILWVFLTLLLFGRGDEPPVQKPSGKQVGHTSHRSKP